MSPGPAISQSMISIPGTRSAPVDAPSTELDPTSAELRALLFGADRERIHGPWRELATDPGMYRRHETSSADQLAASYERLRRGNTVGGAPRLAADPYRLASLHEWTAAMDGALTVLAGIHYN